MFDVVFGYWGVWLGVVWGCVLGCVGLDVVHGLFDGVIGCFVAFAGGHFDGGLGHWDHAFWHAGFFCGVACCCGGCDCCWVA